MSRDNVTIPLATRSETRFTYSLGEETYETDQKLTPNSTARMITTKL